MAKKICISRTAHDRLKRLRDDGETFSEAILRLAD
jgi:predicted CopG family antitoxin